MLRMFVAAACAVSGISAGTAALKIELPAETATFKPGPHLDLVKARCLVCHSADYVSTQPPNLPRATWTAEVNKMKKVYGAPLGDEDIEPLVEYLVKTYGNERTD
jgi:sulfite dehydrogenase (cytochrome) subunit B